MQYIIALLLIGFVILVHEFGHFIAARVVGIPIRIFSIGFGPKLWAVKKRETEYRIAMIPLGGYVMPDVEDDKQFLALSLKKRIAMTVGGPLASIILPLFCFALINCISMGFGLNSFFIKPIHQTYSTFSGIIVAFLGIFSHHSQLSGIIGIVSQGGHFIGMSFLKAIQFIGLISLNLAVLNLVPLPVLDGGKIFLFLIEGIHPKCSKVHYPLAVAGWILVMGLTLYATVIDVLRLV